MHTEEALYKGCRKYDKRTQKQAYEAYASMMRGVCYRYAQNDEEISDILQEGFVKIFVNIRSFVWKGKGSFLAWMKTVMINTAITYYHKQKKFRKEISYQAGDIDEEKNENLAQLENNLGYDTNDIIDSRRFSEEEIMYLLKTVPEDFRIVFNLYVIEGYSHKEISQLLNIKDETSRTRLLRAKNILKNELLRIENQRLQ